jgi:hypothetical protein
MRTAIEYLTERIMIYINDFNFNLKPIGNDYFYLYIRKDKLKYLLKEDLLEDTSDNLYSPWYQGAIETYYGDNLSDDNIRVNMSTKTLEIVGNKPYIDEEEYKILFKTNTPFDYDTIYKVLSKLARSQKINLLKN